MFTQSSSSIQVRTFNKTHFFSIKQSFVDAIVLLFRACITKRCIPEVWKTAIVVALHKKGSVHNPNEYRPVSLTCILCKIYEKLVRDYILEGIETAWLH